MFRYYPDIFADFRDPQGHAINSMNRIARIASGFFRAYSCLKATRLAFPSDFNFFAQEALQLIAYSLKSIYCASAIFDQDVIAAVAAHAATYGNFGRFLAALVRCKSLLRN